MPSGSLHGRARACRAAGPRSFPRATSAGRSCAWSERGLVFQRPFGAATDRAAPEALSDLALEQERDEEREQNERLDEREAENHRRLDARSGAGVTADALERSG